MTRRLLGFLLLFLLLAAPVEAQRISPSGGSGGPIATQSCTTTNKVPRLSTASTSAAVLDCSSITDDGTDATFARGIITSGSAAAPTFVRTAAATTGAFIDSSGHFAQAVGGVQYVGIRDFVRLESTSFMAWTSGNIAAAVDAGWKRGAAGVVQAMDGSTGAGRYGAVVQSVTCTDNTIPASAASLTITPSSNVIAITNADGDGCDITVSETGALAGTVITFVVISNTGGTVNFADSAGVTELAGAFAAGLEDTITLVYAGTAYREVARSNN